MEKKYQIFVSSTFRDLVEERQDTIRSILDLGHIPAGMELFPASDIDQLVYIKKVIDECDYYILVIGGRYGSLDEQGISFTEREYDYAVDSGKVVLAFVHGSADSIPLGKSDTSPNLVAALSKFREKVMQGRLVKSWTTRESLESLVIKSIVHAIASFPANGWVRGNVSAGADILQQINDLRQRNDKLTADNRTLRLEAAPAIVDLAGVDENITVRYTYTRRYGNSTSEQKSELVITWLEIFVATAPLLKVATTSYSINRGLSTFLKEVRNVESVARFFDSDIEVVKTQLVALGYVKAFVSKTVKGGVAEFLQLTSGGSALLLQTLAVRTKKEQA